jgi:protein SCO1/2
MPAALALTHIIGTIVHSKRHDIVYSSILQDRRMARLAAIIIILPVMLLYGVNAFPHTDSGSLTHLNGEVETQQASKAGVGLDERLGGKIPLELSFRDETGRKVRLSELVTGPTIILPVYYSCTNVCNFLQQGLASALPKVQQAPAKDYRVLSVSFDETETPELAAKFKRTYLTSMNSQFPEDGWRFLTGGIEEIRGLTNAAGYRFKRQGRDFIHPVVSMVITRDGTIVRYLYGTSFLPKDITLALLEAKDGKIGRSVHRLIDYCFTFDPQGKTYVFNLLRVSATVVIVMAGSFLAFLILTGKKLPKRRS